MCMQTLAHKCSIAALLRIVSNANDPDVLQQQTDRLWYICAVGQYLVIKRNGLQGPLGEPSGNYVG